MRFRNRGKYGKISIAMNDIELLAPAGSFETALAAFAAGADATYLGLDAFSARAEAVNLSAVQLEFRTGGHCETTGNRDHYA